MAKIFPMLKIDIPSVNERPSNDWRTGDLTFKSSPMKVQQRLQALMKKHLITDDFENRLYFCANKRSGAKGGIRVYMMYRDYTNVSSIVSSIYFKIPDCNNNTLVANRLWQDNRFVFEMSYLPLTPSRRLLVAKELNVSISLDKFIPSATLLNMDEGDVLKLDRKMDECFLEFLRTFEFRIISSNPVSKKEKNPLDDFDWSSLFTNYTFAKRFEGTYEIDSEFAEASSDVKAESA